MNTVIQLSRPVKAASVRPVRVVRWLITDAGQRHAVCATHAQFLRLLPDILPARAKGRNE